MTNNVDKQGRIIKRSFLIVCLAEACKLIELSSDARLKSIQFQTGCTETAVTVWVNQSFSQLRNTWNPRIDPSILRSVKQLFQEASKENKSDFKDCGKQVKQQVSLSPQKLKVRKTFFWLLVSKWRLLH